MLDKRKDLQHSGSNQDGRINLNLIARASFLHSAVSSKARFPTDGEHSRFRGFLSSFSRLRENPLESIVNICDSYNVHKVTINSRAPDWSEVIPIGRFWSHLVR